MVKKVLIPLFANEVAPRFDLATEVLIALVTEDGDVEERRNVVLPRPSSEQLSRLVLTEGVHTVICGGIEEEYYQYLTWKKVKVLDSVMGPFETALERFARGDLTSGEVLFERRTRRGGRGPEAMKPGTEEDIEEKRPDQDSAGG